MPAAIHSASNRLLRLPQIIGDKNADPPIQPIIPVSKSSWWAGVASGRFPKPVKIGARCTAWKESEVLALVNQA
ncbi:MAG: AlpA family phage regulatory protein [Rhodobacteraceae bacterium]|nr:AlpA family phage regulatory protein [Paracoccaceae bacterium]